MNLILFEPNELSRPLPLADARSRHILQVLRRRVGDAMDVGLIDGPRGSAVLRGVGPEGLVLDFTWGETPPELPPVMLVVGLTRPQTSRRILRDAAALGVRRMLFVRTDRGEPGYASSRLWLTGEYRRHVLAGVEQAFTTRVPQVEYGLELAPTLREISGTAPVRCALDNYEAVVSLEGLDLSAGPPVTLAVGSERGWSPRERQVLRAHGFVLAGMGPRVLRTDTAVVAALAVLQARLGLWG